MNHKVLGSVFVLAVALGVIGVAVRSPQAAPTPKAPMPPAKPDLARPLASYRVHEKETASGIEYRAANYLARVSPESSSFGAIPIVGARLATSPEFKIEFGVPRLEQGGQVLECVQGASSRPAFGVARIDRGAVVEEYIFENHRIEQLFRLPIAVGTGALKLSIP